jgi:tRNA pseudouridine55 synthase
MGRRRKPPEGARAIDGWLVVDKPLGLSSAAVVARLRRVLKPMRIGHGGTLDPLATGILPVALGEATKTVSYAMEGTKAYTFTVRFGECRDTGDAEGTIVETSDRRPETAAIEAVMARFTGEIEQIPPAYSAIKLGGKPAYARARKGEVLDLKPRTVMIHDLRLIERPDLDHAVFEATCGKGVYIRALGRDLAVALGTVGTLTKLRRTQVGPFFEGDAIPLDNLITMGHSAPAFEYLHPVETVLDDIPALAVTGKQAADIRHGRPVRVLRTGGPGPQGAGQSAESSELSDGTVVCAMEGNKLVALARYCSGEIRPVRVLNI